MLIDSYVPLRKEFFSDDTSTNIMHLVEFYCIQKYVVTEIFSLKEQNRFVASADYQSFVMKDKHTNADREN